jgi:hypothetical protein
MEIQRIAIEIHRVAIEIQRISFKIQRIAIEIQHIIIKFKRKYDNCSTYLLHQIPQTSISTVLRYSHPSILTSLPAYLYQNNGHCLGTFEVLIIFFSPVISAALCL